MQMVMTRGINNRMEEDKEFAKFATESLEKFLRHDWGETCEEDAELNNSEPEYAMGAYRFKGNEEDKIWIKRDLDIITVLFPDEY